MVRLCRILLLLTDHLPAMAMYNILLLMQTNMIAGPEYAVVNNVTQWVFLVGGLLSFLAAAEVLQKDTTMLHPVNGTSATTVLSKDKGTCKTKMIDMARR